MKSDNEKVYRKSVKKISQSCAIYTFDKIIGKSKNFVSVIEYAKKYLIVHLLY